MRTPTQRDYYRLATAAAEIALVPPRRRTPYAENAIIPWALIEDLRSELERSGIDWRAAKIKTEKDRGWAVP